MNERRSEALRNIERVAREVAASLGLEVVDLVFHSRGRHSLLRIDVDRPGVPGAGLADCEALSRALDGPLEAVDFFDAPYELQVSTPGIDRPIRTPDDVRRNIGRPVWLEYKDPSDRVRELRAILAGPSGSGGVRLTSPEGDVDVGFERILLMRQDVASGKPRRRAR